jgi:spermidine synthase
MMKRSRTVHEVISPMTGRIRVVDYRSERRLIVAGEILSIFPLNGDWSYIRKEYWWHALALAAPDRGGTALFVGLGGGTQVHLLTRLARPKLVTLIERDPEMITIACDWFDLRKLGPLEFMCGEAQDLLPTLNAAGRQFDLVVEDAAYAAPPEQSMAIGKALAPLVAPGGSLVINRHRRGDGRRLATMLRSRFETVRVQRVRREGENVLVCADRPKQPKRQLRGSRL